VIIFCAALASCPCILIAPATLGAPVLAAGPLGLGLGKGLIAGVPSIAHRLIQRTAINHVALLLHRPPPSCRSCCCRHLLLPVMDLLQTDSSATDLSPTESSETELSPETESLPTESLLHLWVLELVFSEPPLVLESENLVLVLELPSVLDSAKLSCKYFET
ncbi:hypothetical protein TNCT_196401, partial [Trichonephila clavata]